MMSKYYLAYGSNLNIRQMAYRCPGATVVGFKTMIQDAVDGKIDLILTKSISRFARNTLDSI